MKIGTTVNDFERTDLMNRASGVLMHISTLYGDYSIGSFGKNAKEFVDFLRDCGFSYWQVLPFNMSDECGSPYKSYGAFSGNPYFVDLESLAQKGLLTASELAAAKQKTPYSCEFERLECERLTLLKKAAARVCREEREKIERIISLKKSIFDFCRFMALKEANNYTEWNEWTTESYDAETLFAWEFIEYEFLAQWSDIRAYANQKGIKIIGDIPIYVAYDSSDVWANKNEFQLDSNGRLKAVAGVPPDYFAKDGQLWGNPIYDWNAMKKNGFSWWSERLKYMLELFDGVRIDHFRGIESYWSIPADAKTAKDGKWVKGPGRKFVDMARKLAGENLIIAEDLGDITEDVVKLVDYSGFPGMRVLQFAFLGEPDSPHLPHNYINNCVAYTGTHDNNTLLGYMWEAEDGVRRRVIDYCGYMGEDWDKSYDNIIRAMLASHAGLVIIPIQDLLNFGSDTRMNIPGSAEGNWRYRITREQLERIDRAKYKYYNELYSR